MKTMKTLLAASIVTAVAGSANAAITTYDVTVQGLITGISTGYISNTTASPGTDPSSGLGIPPLGTATYDSVAGTLFVDVAYNTYIAAPASAPPGDFRVETTYSYTLDGSLNTISGTGNNVACTAGTVACPAALNQGTPFPLSVTGTGNGGGLLEQAFNPAGGNNTFVIRQYNGYLVNSYTLGFTPAVPVPAAAWLFGSGLLGLAGTTRRRRRVA